MAWYGMRSIYLFGKKSDGTNIYEERIVSIESDSFEAALEKGALESERYAAENEIEALPEREGYEQDGDTLIDEYELWSCLFESRESPAEFYASRYAKYDYEPE